MHAVLPSHDLTEFYRLAVLLGGDPAIAEELVAGTIQDLSRQLGQVRNSKAARQLVALRLRERYLALEKDSPAESRPYSSNGSGHDSSLEFARQFHSLPEPHRSALALFHLDLLTTSEIAQVLNVRLEELADILSTARQQLRSRAK